MTPRTRIWLATALVAMGVLIPLVWYAMLRPFLRGEGPSPGAGAQYVFVLLPSIALAAIALVAGGTLAYLARQHPSRPLDTFAQLLIVLAGLGASVLAIWLIAVAPVLAAVTVVLAVVGARLVLARQAPVERQSPAA